MLQCVSMPRSPQKPPKIQFTKEGYEKVRKEHEELQTQRKQAVKELATASAMGDRSENAAYKVARQKLGAIDRQIRHTAMLLRFGIVVEREFTGKVDIGCKVMVDNGTETKEYTIVGGYESDLSTGKISCFSPIGKTLMHKKLGDIVSVEIPAGVLKLTIKNIELAS